MLVGDFITAAGRVLSADTLAVSVTMLNTRLPGGFPVANKVQISPLLTGVDSLVQRETGLSGRCPGS